MKYRTIVWPVILIVIGLIILMSNLGWLHFHWATIWHLWPVILIIWGISILPVRDLYKFIALGVTVLLTFTFFNRITENSFWFRFNNEDFQWGERWNDETPSRWKSEAQTLVIPFDTVMHRGHLYLDAGAGEFTIADTTPDYVHFEKDGDVGNYSMTSEDKDGVKQVRIKLQDKSINRHSRKNSVDISLNPKPAWNVDLNIGAADITMGLEHYILDTLNVNVGASSIDITLGDRSPKTVVVLNAGASSIDLHIPASAGCEARSESFLVSRDFEGFSKKSEGVYQTDNFATAKNRIYIEVKTAVSSIGIKRY